MPSPWTSTACTSPPTGAKGSGGAFEGGRRPRPPLHSTVSHVQSTSTINRRVSDDSTSSRRSSDSSSSSQRTRAAACTIREVCERLFCTVLAHVFLGEQFTAKDVSDQNVLGVDMSGKSNIINSNDSSKQKQPEIASGLPTPEASPTRHVLALDGSHSDQSQQPVLAHQSKVERYLEIWDYADNTSDGAHFRGFVTNSPVNEPNGDKTLFVFPQDYDDTAMALDRSSLVALLELAESTEIACTRLVVGLDRQTDPALLADQVKALGFVGFGMQNLVQWASSGAVVSDKWLLLGIDV